MQHGGKHLAILRALDALRAGTEDVDAVGLQTEREFNGVCPPNWAMAPQQFSRS